ncbi:MAG: M56 family metallopeptidase [Eubacteriales bacterium]
MYLPSDMDESQTGYVTAHENAHLKRGDHLWKPLGFALLTVYWFNPLCWLAYALLCRDIELVCGERV